MVQDAILHAEKKVTLTLFNIQVEELQVALDLQVILKTCTEDEFLIAILTCYKILAMVCNMSTHKVIPVKPVNDQ